MDVMLELKSVGECLKANDFSTGLKKLADVWERIPEPKTTTPNAYMVIEYGAAFALKMRDLDEAQKWASLAPRFIEKRRDRGEVEFLMGKVAFERGEFEAAKRHFATANEKSEGRIFHGENPEYKALIH